MIVCSAEEVAAGDNDKGRVAMRRWQIGDVTVTRVVEIQIDGSTKFILPQATREECLQIDWLRPHFMDDKGNLRMSVHGLIIDTGKRKIMVDTCIGNDKPRSIPAWDHMQTHFLEDMAQAGYPREDIDTVLCTHLHVDHVGWNTMLVDGHWVPTFTNARYLFSAREWDYWNASEPGRYGPVIEDSVRPVVEAGLVDLVNDDHVLCPEVRLQSTPGHTPGHVSVIIESNGRRAMITGDFMHHPVQMTRTHWGSSADYDKVVARRTREEVLASCAADETLVIGTHFVTPTAGYVKELLAGGYYLATD